MGMAWNIKTLLLLLLFVLVLLFGLLVLLLLYRPPSYATDTSRVHNYN